MDNIRSTTFFNKRKYLFVHFSFLYLVYSCLQLNNYIGSAEQLWKGVTSVSNAGKRRGRARGLTRKKDLNKGQIIGKGRIPIQFPGLNVPVIRGKEILKQQRFPEDPERQEKLIKLRESISARKSVKLSSLERGWTSHKPGGMKLGPPDPVGDGKIFFPFYEI